MSTGINFLRCGRANENYRSESCLDVTVSLKTHFKNDSKYDGIIIFKPCLLSLFADRYQMST